MIRERNGRLEATVYFGRDPVTGREVKRSRTITGTGRDALRAAKRAEAELLDERDEWRSSGPAAIVLTFDELLDRWLAVARHEASTRQRGDSALALHVRPVLGAVRIDKITTGHLNDLYVTLERRLAASTVVRIHAMVRPAFQHAVIEGLLDTNPAALARLPELPPPDPRPPTPDVVGAVLLAAVEDAPELARLVRVQAVTGMRRGEICALRRSDVDLDHLAVRKTHAIGEGQKGSYEKPTKTRARGAIAIDAGTAGALKMQIDAVTARADELEVELVPDPYIFGWSPDGSTWWTPNSVTKTFAKVRATVAKTRPEAAAVKLKHLRHFVATQLLAAGVDIGTVAGRLAHARRSTTIDIYTAFLPPADRHAAEVMGSIVDELEQGPAAE